MGNWDVFIMYSGDSWMNAFDQWYYWELSNFLLNQEDSNENIIYIEENEDDETSLLHHPVDSKNLVQSSFPLQQQKQQKEIKKEEPEEINPLSLSSSQISIPLSTSPPIYASSVPVPSNIYEPAKPRASTETTTARATPKNSQSDQNPPTAVPQKSSSTWKIGRKRFDSTPLIVKEQRMSRISSKREEINENNNNNSSSSHQENNNNNPQENIDQEKHNNINSNNNNLNEIENQNENDNNNNNNRKLKNNRSAKIQRMNSYRISVGLLEETHKDKHDTPGLLPDIVILLPPCLHPTNPCSFIGFDIPAPNFHIPAPGSSQKTNYNIQKATLMKLVEHLTTPYSHDLQYMKIFMLTYIYFTTPQTLLRLLIRRYFVYPGKSLHGPNELQEWEERVKKPIKLRVFNILKFWLENYEMDFEQNLLTCIKEFAQKSLPPIMSKQILRVLVQKRNGAGKPKTVSDFQFNAAPPYPDVPKNIFSQTLHIWDISDLEISRQLTIIEFNLFSAIRPRELLNQSWKHPKRQKISPNILKMLARFQDLSGKWVPQMIERAPDLRQKVKVLKRFINISMELMKLNNFHDAMAILQGIKIQCEIRFHRIWASLPNKFKKDYQSLEDIMNYEEQYKEHLPSRHPCIPHLGKY